MAGAFKPTLLLALLALRAVAGGEDGVVFKNLSGFPCVLKSGRINEPLKVDLTDPELGTVGYKECLGRPAQITVPGHGGTVSLRFLTAARWSEVDFEIAPGQGPACPARIRYTFRRADAPPERYPRATGWDELDRLPGTEKAPRFEVVFQDGNRLAVLRETSGKGRVAQKGVSHGFPR